MTNVIAIIPARAGSKSVADKNIALMAGFPLIAYSIAAARKSSLIDRVLVSTDSQQYADLAIKYGAEVPFLRPEELSTDTSTDREFMLHAMHWCLDNEAHVPEYWVHLRPTTPLRDTHIMDQAISRLMASGRATSLRSGHKAPESPIKWFQRDSEGFFRGLFDKYNFGKNRLVKERGPEYYNLPKEAFPQVFIPDGYVDVLKADHVMNNSTLHGELIMGFESPVCTEVDSLEELNYLQYQLSQNPSVLLNYLRAEYTEDVA